MSVLIRIGGRRYELPDGTETLRRRPKGIGSIVLAREPDGSVRYFRASEGEVALTREQVGIVAAQFPEDGPAPKQAPPPLSASLPLDRLRPGTRVHVVVDGRPGAWSAWILDGPDLRFINEGREVEVPARVAAEALATHFPPLPQAAVQLSGRASSEQLAAPPETSPRAAGVEPRRPRAPHYRRQASPRR